MVVLVSLATGQIKEVCVNAIRRIERWHVGDGRSPRGILKRCWERVEGSDFGVSPRENRGLKWRSWMPALVDVEGSHGPDHPLRSARSVTSHSREWMRDIS